MKKGIIFIALFVAFAISLVLLLRTGAKANDYTFWIVLILLPLVGYGVAKIDFRTDD
jgi:membrane protease YdiL (CAAX protease family)